MPLTQFLNTHKHTKKYSQFTKIHTYSRKNTTHTSNAYGGGEWGNVLDDKKQRKRKKKNNKGDSYRPIIYSSAPNNVTSVFELCPHIYTHTTPTYLHRYMYTKEVKHKARTFDNMLVWELVKNIMAYSCTGMLWSC